MALLEEANKIEEMHGDRILMLREWWKKRENYGKHGSKEEYCVAKHRVK